jgi:hypothetical protein
LFKEDKIMEKIGTVKVAGGSGIAYDVCWNSSTKKFSVGGQLVGTADTKDLALRKADRYACDPFNYRD